MTPSTRQNAPMPVVPLMPEPVLCQGLTSHRACVGNYLEEAHAEKPGGLGVVTAAGYGALRAFSEWHFKNYFDARLFFHGPHLRGNDRRSRTKWHVERWTIVRHLRGGAGAILDMLHRDLCLLRSHVN
eukprot:1231513-Rhodomonas_salina.1